MSGFESAIQKFAARACACVRKTRSGFVENLLQSVLEQTPVATGLLRANWQAASGHAPQGRCALRSESAVRSEIVAASEALNDTDGEVFLVNNLLYARAVEYGTAGGQAAPAGMLRGALAEAPAILNRAAGKVK
ncbi:MAG: hypothetical protein LBV79_04540 [Candidatus Adiutrix sp.]|jgi:uncharacterized protein CbrC (UPF0167 family)|nr:hypothetical protein [Candidatus Adiutrix sp.]